MKLLIHSQTSTVQALEFGSLWINNFLSHFIMGVISYPCLKLNHFSERGRCLAEIMYRPIDMHISLIWHTGQWPIVIHNQQCNNCLDKLQWRKTSYEYHHRNVRVVVHANWVWAVWILRIWSNHGVYVNKRIQLLFFVVLRHMTASKTIFYTYLGRLFHWPWNQYASLTLYSLVKIIITQFCARPLNKTNNVLRYILTH